MDGRTGRITGSVLMLAGALAMVVSMISPAAADPHTPQGNATGWGNNHSIVAPAADPTTTTTVSGDPNGVNGGCGDYCPDGVGLPSGNGNGNGNATGQPCAGCVGNADGKNPPGQFKNGGDPNNGYECDGNNGIAKTNPAHTGCHDPESTTTTAPCHGNDCNPCEGNDCNPCTGNSCETTTTTAVVLATEQTTTTTAGATVLGEQFTRPGSSASPSPLAFTGGSFAGLFWAGMVLVLVGTAFLARRRRVQAE